VRSTISQRWRSFRVDPSVPLGRSNGRLAMRAVPDLDRPVGWRHRLLAQLRDRMGDGVGAEAGKRAAIAVFGRIGEREGLAAVAETTPAH
jgi:hypothetical protein